MNSFCSLSVLVSCFITLQVHGYAKIDEMSNFIATCGRDLSSENGVLHSPNYPKEYPPNQKCIWKITLPENYQVALKFKSFELEDDINCDFDFLEIRDGHESTSSVLGKFCGNKIPEDILSSSNKMTVKFVSDGLHQRAGFAAEFIKDVDECKGDHGCEYQCVNTIEGYRCECTIGFKLDSDGRKCEASCGGVIKEANGTITSPSYPDLYPPNQNCIWEIIAPPRYKIMLNFTHFDIEGNRKRCGYDKVEIRSKIPGNEVRKRTTFCGSRLPHVITSKGNQLRIEFSSDNSVQRSGFHALFVTDEDKCALNNGGCQHLCKDTIGSYTCACHGGYVLHENLRDCKEVICSEDISSESGSLYSPNYPKDYWPNKECTWKITVPENYQVALKFLTFELENSHKCGYDYVEIRDGHESWSPMLGKFCGHKVPEDILSSSNKMAVKFVSDRTKQEAGFAAEFIKDVDECKGDHGCEHECTNTLGSYRCECRSGFELDSGGRNCVDACNKVIQQASGTITSPSFPDNYPPNRHCIWEIIAPPQHRIILNFTHFELEGDSKICAYDMVNIQSKMSKNEVHNHGTFCGFRLPPVITSEGQYLNLEFSSDNSEQKRGFSAHFFTETDECATKNGGCEHVCEDTIGNYTCSCRDGFVLHENKHDCKEAICGGYVSSDKGFIHSPNYPGYYWPNRECTWKITVAENHRVELKFQSFQVEHGNNCENDYLEVRDGHKSTSSVLGKFCGNMIPEAIHSSSNKMAVKFVTDADLQATGFVAVFYTGSS